MNKFINNAKQNNSGKKCVSVLNVNKTFYINGPEKSISLYNCDQANIFLHKCAEI